MVPSPPPATIASAPAAIPSFVAHSISAPVVASTMRASAPSAAKRSSISAFTASHSPLPEELFRMNRIMKRCPL